MKIQIFKYLIIFLLVFFNINLQAKTPLVLFVGDSLTEGYGIEKKKAFPEIIKNNLKNNHKKNIEILNAGVSGSTSASAVSRLRWFMKKDPDLIVLALGANDGLRGIDPKETYKNLKSAILYIKEQKKKILFCGVRVPPNYGKAFEAEFLKTFSQLAKEQKVPFVPHILKDVAGNTELNQEDGIHPNEKGHEIMAKNLTEKILELL